MHLFKKSTWSLLLSLNIKYINLERPPQVYSEFEKINASIQKVLFKYTSNFECKFVNLESLLQVYFWPR